MSTVLVQLYQRYSEEGTFMSDALKQFADEFIARLPHEQFAAEIVARILKDLPLEKRLEGLAPKELLSHVLEEKRLEGLTPEQRQELLRLLLGNASKE